ncbi:MAG TPA: TonB-dependent receptor plug domain-containing protein [Acidobacteriaceae bacterium]|nr:TonB-dependent receptor plug domain-containing protein [Acidobacteriaceae bacterium]
MTSSSPRAAFVVLALAGLAGCASTGRSTQHPATKPPMVTSEDIEHNSGQTIEELLQSKVPGVLITRTANGIALEIRGTNSFMGSSQPLFVVDGIPMEPGSGGVLTGVNPHDIATIQVLKNPADIAMYGVRGANGVIIITTKRAGKGS